ncbi:MAG: toll/interleukin-1 receptor domain-containing protein, partial [Verrucomicrobiota bacterium]
MMAAAKRVFLSYRRADFGGGAEGIVGRLYDKLSEELGRENVFMDVDTIPLGVDFVEYLGQEVGKADVLLVVMGPQWMEEMTRRAGEEGDFVRIEIEAALERGIPVVPLLLSGAVMPKKEELPPSLERLP